MIYHKGSVVSDRLPIDCWHETDVNVFETMRIYSGRVFCEEEHLERLKQSAQAMGCPLPLPIKEIRRELHLAVKAYGEPEALVRLTFVGNRLLVMLGKREHSKLLYQKGIALRTSPVKRSLSHAALPEAKTSSFHNGVLASLEPSGEKNYDWILLDRLGHVTEVRTGNIFMIKRENKVSDKDAANRQRFRLITPPLLGVLNGITRRVVIECASEMRLRIKEQVITRHDLFNASEVFLTNTSWEVLPVRELDGRQIGAGKPGPLTLKIHQAFQDRIVEYLKN